MTEKPNAVLFLFLFFFGFKAAPNTTSKELLNNWKTISILLLQLPPLLELMATFFLQLITSLCLLQ